MKLKRLTLVSGPKPSRGKKEKVAQGDPEEVVLLSRREHGHISRLALETERKDSGREAEALRSQTCFIWCIQGFQKVQVIASIF